VCGVADAAMTIHFTATIVQWRGPSTFFFAPIPGEHTPAIRAAAKRVSYGWGVIPVKASVGEVVFTTSLFPKDDAYLLPLKDAVRRRCNVTAGDTVEIVVTLGPQRRRETWTVMKVPNP
jgi:hypothetical protein